MDTGASPGDFISGDLLARLQGAVYVYQTPHPIIVRGALNAQSFVSYEMLDIAFHFDTSKNVAKVVRLSVRINPHSSIDLIIGLTSFRKLNFFRYFAYRFKDDPVYLNDHDETTSHTPYLRATPMALSRAQYYFRFLRPHTYLPQCAPALQAERPDGLDRMNSCA